MLNKNFKRPRSKIPVCFLRPYLASIMWKKYNENQTHNEVTRHHLIKSLITLDSTWCPSDSMGPKHGLQTR